MTKVVVPLQGGAEMWRSGSSTGLPGLIWFDLNQGRLKIIEALVHESAHQYFFLAEAAGPLSDPEHTGKYRSPLRPDPRPLRGIMLAHHALAFMCAAYRDSISFGIDAKAASVQLHDMLSKLNDAEETIRNNLSHLTALGATFFENAVGVGQYEKFAK